jgi:hypothetical protein
MKTLEIMLLLAGLLVGGIGIAALFRAIWAIKILRAPKE